MQKTGEYNSNYAFLYNGHAGYVYSSSKCGTYAVRPVSAL